MNWKKKFSAPHRQDNAELIRLKREQTDKEVAKALEQATTVKDEPEPVVEDDEPTDDDSADAEQLLGDS